MAHGALAARRPCGAPLSTAHAWALLELLEGPKTVGALAERLNIDRSNVSRLCERMEALGEVEKASHPSDGRARLVRLTARGLRVARSVDASSTAHFLGVLDRLGADPAEITEALLTLSRALADSRSE